MPAPLAGWGQMACTKCGQVVERRAAVQQFCRPCRITHSKAVKADWSRRRGIQRREALRIATQGQLTLEEGFIVKQKRTVPKSAVCRKCGVTFSFLDRTLREYCSTSCWYKRNLLPDGSKACGVCKEVKTSTEFTKGKSSCKRCTTDRTIAYFDELKKRSSVTLLCMRAAAGFCRGLGGQRTMRDGLEAKLTECLATNGACPYCNNPISLSTFSFDHIIPKSRGGAYNDPNNVHITCLRCNSMKGNIGHEAFLSVKAFLTGMSEDERKIIEARLLSGNSRFMRKA